MSIFRHSEIEAEYERWKRKLPLDCSNLGLNYDDVLTVHFILVDMFYGRQSGIGGIGPKSLDLMISAVSRQDVSFGGIDKWSRPEELAATLMYGIILNHPFFDANKRTAFLSTILLLNKYGLTITINEKQFEDFTVSVADRSFKRWERYQRTFAGAEDGDVKYIAHFLKHSTRQTDKKDYLVTYRELNSLLRRFGYYLENPRDNTIEVVREDGQRICKIGYPGMSRQVGKSVIKKVRTETGLDFLSGCDSGAFFKGEEPINNLLAKYYEPLERLAFR